MNIIISLIYAPFVFFSLRYFDIQIVSIFIFILSCVWLGISLRVSKKEALYPLLYMIIGSITFVLEDFLVLKAMPLIISTVITSIITISYLNKNSVILYFAKKFSKKQISFEEQNYIQQSTLFWIGVSGVNIIFHLFVLLNENISFWVFYSSIGWYGVFLLAGILQYLHRQFVFLKRLHV